MFAAALLLAAVAAAPIKTASSRPELHVSIQVDADVSLRADDLRMVADDVRRIWAPMVAIVVSLPGERVPAGAIDSIQLIVTNRTLNARENTGLGWIEFVGDAPAHEITVSVAAVQRLMTHGAWMGRSLDALPPAASRLFVRRALARAIAHEIGHYLLRTRDHDRRGLMRATFSPDEIMDPRAAFERLDGDSAKRFFLTHQAARLETAAPDGVAEGR